MPIPRASEAEGYEVISTGLAQVDRILGGGIPTKRITEISGPWSVGKTSLALSLVAQAQSEGRECIWVDAEWAWDSEYAKKLGVDTDELGLLQTRAAEDSLDELLEYVEKGKKVANGPDDVETTYCHCTVGKSYEFFDNDFSAWWKEQVKSLANAKKV